LNHTVQQNHLLTLFLVMKSGGNYGKVPVAVNAKTMTTEHK